MLKNRKISANYATGKSEKKARSHAPKAGHVFALVLGGFALRLRGLSCLLLCCFVFFGCLCCCYGLVVVSFGLSGCSVVYGVIQVVGCVVE